MAHTVTCREGREERGGRRGEGGEGRGKKEVKRGVGGGIEAIHDKGSINSTPLSSHRRTKLLGTLSAALY